MRKNSGFTLIELLAVITIMGILMLVAIPAVSRTIENSRKDTFLDTVNQYVESMRTMWASDNLYCDGFTSSAVQSGVYYIEVDSSRTDVPQLLEKGGKSPWGSREIRGIIALATWIEDYGTPSETRKVMFYPALVDGIHGVNVKGDAVGTADSWKVSTSLKRGNVVMTGAGYNDIGTVNADGTVTIKQPTFNFDLNQDGDKNDVIDGIRESGSPAIKCVEN